MTETNLTVRIEAELKEAAIRAAKANDESVSQVVRRALRAYVQEHAQTDLFEKPRKRK